MRSGQGRVLKGLLIMFSLQRIMTFLCGCSQLYKAEAAQSCRSFLFIAWREVGMDVGLTGPEGYKDSRIYPLQHRVRERVVFWQVQCPENQ